MKAESMEAKGLHGISPIQINRSKQERLNPSAKLSETGSKKNSMNFTLGSIK